MLAKIKGLKRNVKKRTYFFIIIKVYRFNAFKSLLALNSFSIEGK